MKRSGTIVAVTAALVAGLVWWWSASKGDVALEPGVRPGPSAESVAPARMPEDPIAAPDPSAVRTSVPAPPADITVDPAFELVGHVVDHHTEAFLAGVDVRFVVRRPGEPTYEARVTSDADGRFRAPFRAALDPSALPEMRFTRGGLGFQARLDGYAPYEGMPWSIDGGEAQVVDGHQRVDVGQVRLRRGASIAGRVVDANSTGIAEAVVHAIEDSRLTTSMFAAQPTAIATTDGAGSFATRKLLPLPTSGNELLVATSPRGVGTAVVPLVQGRTAVVGVTIVVGPQAALEVHVIDEAERPLADARVRVEPRFPPLDPFGFGHDVPEMIWNSDDRALVEAFTRTSDERGVASFELLPLQVNADGTPRAASPYAVVVEREGYGRFHDDPQAPPKLLPGTRTRYAARLMRAGTGVLTGWVVDQDRKRLPGATITVRGDLPTRAVSAAAGTFEVRGFDATMSEVHVSVELEGYCGAEHDLSLGTVGEMHDIEIELRQQLPTSGLVVDADGRPVAGVHVWGMCGGKLVMATEPDGSMGRTGIDGRFVLNDTFAGTWSLGTEPPPPLDKWEPCAPVRANAGAEDVRIVLKRVVGPLARVEIDIVDGVTDAPLDPVEANLMSAGRVVPGRINYGAAVERAFGKVIFPRVRPGSWRAWIAVAGHAPGVLEFEVRDDTPQHHVLRIGGAGRLAGRILPAAPEHLPAGRSFVLLTLESRGGIPGGKAFRGGPLFYASAAVGPDGRFLAENLVPGTWRVSWSNSWSQSTAIAEARVDVASARTSEVELRTELAAKLVFAGEARLEAAPAESGWCVLVQLEPVAGGLPARDAYYGLANGPFSVDATLRPGVWRYTLQLVDESRVGDEAFAARPVEGVVELVAGKVIEVPVQLEPR